MLARVGTTRSGAAQLEPVAEQCGDRVGSLVLERLRWHRDQGVVGQQGDDLVDVATLIGVGETPDQLALAGGVGQRRALAVGGRQPRFEGRPGALEGALDRGLAGVEHFGDLGCAETEHVAQHECGALAGLQLLEDDDERELDGLPGRAAGSRSR